LPVLTHGHSRLGFDPLVAAEKQAAVGTEFHGLREGNQLFFGQVKPFGCHQSRHIKSADKRPDAADLLYGHHFDEGNVHGLSMKPNGFHHAKQDKAFLYCLTEKLVFVP